MKNTPALLSAILGCSGLFASPALSQGATPILLEGDLVPGGTGDLISRFDNVDINNSGDWLIELDSDAAVNEQYVLHNGTVVWHEGTTTGFNMPPAGLVAGGFVDTMDINDNGDILLTSPMAMQGSTSTVATVLIRNGDVLIQTGVTPVDPSVGLPQGTLFTGISEAWQNNSNQILFGGLIQDAGLSLDVLMLFDLDPVTGAIVTSTLIAMEGEQLTAPNHVTPIQGFSFSKPRNGINDNGDYFWFVDDDHTVAPGSTLSDSNMYINMDVLFNEADSFPVAPNEVFDSLTTCEMDLNNNGDYVFSGFDRRTDSGADSWIFKNVGGTLTVLAHEGDPVPSFIPGNFLVAGFGFGGNVPISNSGDVLWFMDWDDPNLDVDSALIYNDIPVLFEGVSMLSGLVVDSVPDGADEIAMSDDGRFAIGEVALDGGLDGVYQFEFNLPLGVPYCAQTTPNTSGQVGSLSALGSDVAANDDLTLFGSDLPDGQFAFFVASRMQGLVANPSGSQGNLCILGNLVRFNQAGLVGPVASGGFSREIPLTSFPEPPTFMVQVMAGDTWNFQLWHRDFLPGTGPTSNFTNGLEILFQ